VDIEKKLISTQHWTKPTTPEQWARSSNPWMHHARWMHGGWMRNQETPMPKKFQH